MSETLATIAGLRVSEVPGWASRHGLTAGRFGRYPRCEVETLLRAAEQETRADAQWARMVREPRVAVLLDTETSDLPGAVCEIAVVDCASGETLLDTLVDPGVPITSAASKVHGITDGDVAGSPRWPAVLPVLLEVTRGRRVLAYNASYDRAAVVGECARHGLLAEHLGDAASWDCVLERRMSHLRVTQRPPLHGAHRALADCRAALQVVRHMAASPLERRPQQSR